MADAKGDAGRGEQRAPSAGGKAQDARSGPAEPGEGRRKDGAPPDGDQPAGPHATPELTNTDATPGAGVLPDPEDPADSTEAVSG